MKVTFTEAMEMGVRSFERLPEWQQQAISSYIDSAWHLQPDKPPSE